MLAIALLVVVVAAFAVRSNTNESDDVPIPDEDSTFCAAYRSANGPLSSIENLNLNNEDSVQAAIEDFDALADAAPAEIADDAQATGQVWSNLLEALVGTAPNGRDEILDSFRQELLDVAGSAERLAAYAQRNCSAANIPALPTPTPVPTPTPLAIEG